MANYVMSDLHGHYNQYLMMLDKIGFSDSDMLYILGDIVDRGPHPVKILQDLMKRPNVCCIAGNHEVMFLKNIKFLLQEITENSIAALDEDTTASLVNWMQNGAGPTIAEFSALDKSLRNAILDFVADFEIYEEVYTENSDFLLVHAGLGNYSPD